jgi:GT2 family glycosyltransferase
MSAPQVSIVISNQNGTKWLPKCFDSLRQQTIIDQAEVVMVDNCSTDDSVALARRALAGFPNGFVIENPQDLGFTGGNNTGAAAARSDLIFFLSNDTWLEPDCLEKLISELKKAEADAAVPLVMNYGDTSFQAIGGEGLDWFGIPTGGHPVTQTTEFFAFPGCGFMIRAEMFSRVGGFDTGHFMYAEETDLSWRVQIAGGRIVGAPAARMHHRGAAGVNPAGDAKIVESRTSETKRFLANRNNLLMVMKNSQHIFLLLLIPQLALLFFEMLASALLVRRWSYVRKAYLAAVLGAFGMAGHVRHWRRRIRSFRLRGDFWMLRYLQLRPARWEEVEKLFRLGVPKVDKR